MERTDASDRHALASGFELFVNGQRCVEATAIRFYRVADGDMGGDVTVAVPVDPQAACQALQVGTTATLDIAVGPRVYHLPEASVDEEHAEADPGEGKASLGFAFHGKGSTMTMADGPRSTPGSKAILLTSSEP